MIIHNLFGSSLAQAFDNNKPLCVHNRLWSEVQDIEAFNSLEQLLDFWPSRVDVHLPDLSDEASSISLEPIEALKKYKQGMSLLFNDINDFDSTLNTLVHNLRSELGLSQMTYARNLVYATPKGGGTSAHFDQNINIIYQLYGEKKWWVAPNQSVENPLVRHTIGTQIDPELKSYAYADMPTQMPTQEMEEFTLKAGSVLFLPRGAWHKTLASTDSLALNFTFSAPSWVDLFSAAIRARLVQSPKWRAGAHYVNDPQRCHEAIEEFDSLLQELASESHMWRSQNIFGMTEAYPESEG